MLSHFLLLYLPVFLPLRCCPSWRSFTTWRTETLIMSTWPSLFCSSWQRTIPSIAPSMRWWVDTILMHLSLSVHRCCILSLFSPVGEKHAWRFYKPYPRVTYLFNLQVLKNISWYTERSLTEISLGSLLILVVIRTIQFNMTRTRVGLSPLEWGAKQWNSTAIYR